MRNRNKLWYRQPAEAWDQALPLGNGRLGAMVFGSTIEERYQLNEESLWAGEPLDVYPDGFADHLKIVQRLVLEGKTSEAREYGLKHLTASPTGFRSYQPLGDLRITFEHGAQADHYTRELDLQAGVARAQYTVAGTTFTRESLISAVDDVLAVRISADTAGSIGATVFFERERDAKVVSVKPARLDIDGQIIDIPASDGGYDDNPGGSGPGGEHMRFAGCLVARVTGGTTKEERDRLAIAHADEVLLLFTACTDFNLELMNSDPSIDPGAESEVILERLAGKSWDEMRADHLADHGSFFDRISIHLGESPQDELPTDERLIAIQSGKEDPSLEALYFQFGRYLLMGSSRAPGRLPANLQGIWNEDMWAAWESDYHLNINLQMNYWPADLCNLSETVAPLVDFFARVTEKGRESAKKLYGARGWMTYTCVDLFGRTTPAASNLESQFMNGSLDPLAGAWMAMTLWRHFTYTRDDTFLEERAFPILRGAAEFLLDYLIENEDGLLVVVPSTSPENRYVDPQSGELVRITQGSTYHMSLVREVFQAVVAASEELGVDDDLCTDLKAALAKLPPLAISKSGTIQEWYKDYEEGEPGHRHMSHLMGLHPFAHITSQTKDLLAAAKASLERRLQHGGGHTGWSRAWIVNQYARLHDGTEAHEHLRRLLQKSTSPNLLDVHPPFQIDGNFGGTAGVAEMLVQSHEGPIRLLPALSPTWPTGWVRGLRARGGFVIDIEWEDQKFTRGMITSTAGRRCALYSAAHVTIRSNGALVATENTAPDVVEFETQSGSSYLVEQV
jgi:alpha-L-fucosidase 2